MRYCFTNPFVCPSLRRYRTLILCLNELSLNFFDHLLRQHPSNFWTPAPLQTSSGTPSAGRKMHGVGKLFFFLPKSPFISKMAEICQRIQRITNRKSRLVDQLPWVTLKGGRRRSYFSENLHNYARNIWPIEPSFQQDNTREIGAYFYGSAMPPSWGRGLASEHFMGPPVRACSAHGMRNSNQIVRGDHSEWEEY